jgi:hypothetical protein
MPRFLREHSLSLFFLVIFLAALAGQAIAGHEAYNQEQLTHGERTVSVWAYVTSSSFGNAVMENWQSEYLQFTLFMLATVWFIQQGSRSPSHPAKRGPSRTPGSRSAAGRDPRHRSGLGCAGSGPGCTRTRC